jgi:hypothetical protein
VDDATVRGDHIVVVGKHIPQAEAEQFGRFVDGGFGGKGRVIRRMCREEPWFVFTTWPDGIMDAVVSDRS